MKMYQRLLAGVILSLGTFITAAPSQGATTQDNTIPGWNHVTTATGADIAWDEHTYHYRAADGESMFSLWVPPGEEPMRGLFINGHGGGGGDNRKFIHDRAFRHFAAQHHFGVIGLHRFSGRFMFQEGGSELLNALDSIAALGQHPELKNLPFIVFGSSNGAATAYALTNYAPDRAIAFGMNVGSMRTPVRPTAGALNVPGIAVTGPLDPFARVPGAALASVETARARGAHWAYLEEAGKGHEDGQSMDLFIAFFDACIRLRLPEHFDARTGPVPLRDLPLEQGWLADNTSWKDGICHVAPYSTSKADLSHTSWLPDEATARAYQTIATVEAPIDISVAGLPRIKSPYNAPDNFMSVGGNLVDPGQTIAITAIIPEGMKWQEVSFFDGAQLLGTCKPGSQPSITATVAPGNRKHIFLYATIVDNEGKQHCSRPMHCLIRYTAAPLDLPGDLAPVSTQGCQLTIPMPACPLAPDIAKIKATPSLLGAYHLSDAEEVQFAQTTGHVSPFWATDNDGDSIQMMTKKPIPDRVVAPQPAPEDSALSCRAAYGTKGLYLFYSVQDDQFMTSDSMDDLASIDVIDLMICGHPADWYKTQPKGRVFVNAEWFIPLDAHQIQFNVTGQGLPKLFRNNFADPYELRFYPVETAESTRFYGMQFHLGQRKGQIQEMEWFIPWQLLEATPENHLPGQAYAFHLSYSDRDGAKSHTIRPTGISNPWEIATDVKDWPNCWMDIVLLP